MEILLIGGFRAGEWVEVGDRPLEWHYVPLPVKLPRFFDPHDTAISVDFATETYHLETIQMANKYEYYYRCTELPLEDVMGQLFAGYSASKK